MKTVTVDRIFEIFVPYANQTCFLEGLFAVIHERSIGGSYYIDSYINAERALNGCAKNIGKGWNPIYLVDLEDGTAWAIEENDGKMFRREQVGFEE